MIENLLVNSNEVTWSFGNKIIKIELDNVFYASSDEENEYISIECGTNFIKDSVYFYDFNGELQFSYILSLGVLNWNTSNVEKSLEIKNLKDVGYFPQKQRVFVLAGDCVQGYDLLGEFLYNIKSPNGYKMIYFGEYKDSLFVVCDGDKNHEDKFGRFRVNFIIDKDSGNLTKGELAY